MNNSEYPNIPQAAIDAAYRLMDRVEADRKRQLAMAHVDQNRPFDIVRDMPGADEFVRAAIRSYGRRYNKETGEFEDMPVSESQNKNE